MKRPLDNGTVLSLAVLALIIGGGIVRLLVAGQDLFADELATYWVVSTDGLSGVVETVSSTAEITPPLGFVLSWLATRIELSPELLRLPALIAGIGTIPLVFAIGMRTVGRGAALLAATLTTLSPFMIFYSAEARGYGVMMAFVLLSTLALLVAIDDGRRRWWVAYAAFVCLAAYTHYTSIFVLAAQFGWALWAHPQARRPLLIATAAAALLYIPWLPSLKGDLDSPTTTILSALSPFDLASVRSTLGHWSVGYPFASGTSLRDLPGVGALILIAAGVGVGGYGLASMRSRLGRWFAGRRMQIYLVLALALATPVGAAVASAVGTNVFSTRNLAASWPYLALAGSALVTVGRPAVRVSAAALAVAAFAIGGGKMLGTDVDRPNYSDLARFAAGLPGGVVVDGAAFTPGPLTNFDVEGSSPGVEVLRLNVPDQKQTPFAVGERPPDSAEVARRAVAEADGGPITVISAVPQAPATLALISRLPGRYVLVERRLARGLIDLEALVYEPRGR